VVAALRGVSASWPSDRGFLCDSSNLCSILLHLWMVVKPPTGSILWPSRPCPHKAHQFIPRMHHEGFPARFSVISSITRGVPAS
jgi:hypothetical protein